MRIEDGLAKIYINMNGKGDSPRNCFSQEYRDNYDHIFKMNNNRIVCAAMKMRDGLIVTGIRHFSPEMRVILKRLYGDKYHLQVEEQGFVDNKGNFLNRQEAWVIAEKNGQILKEVSTSGTLYSENLY